MTSEDFSLVATFAIRFETQEIDRKYGAHLVKGHNNGLATFASHVVECQGLCNHAYTLTVSVREVLDGCPLHGLWAVA